MNPDAVFRLWCAVTINAFNAIQKGNEIERAEALEWLYNSNPAEIVMGRFGVTVECLPDAIERLRNGNTKVRLTRTAMYE